MKLCQKAFMTLFLVAVTMLLVLSPVEAEPTSLTLSESIVLALENSPTLKVAEAAKEKSVWTLNQARAYQGFTVNYTFTGLRTTQPPYQYTLKPVHPYEYYSHQVKLQLPIYTGGKVENNIKAAKLGREIADLSVTATKQQLVLSVTTAYFNTLHAYNLADVAQQSVTTLEAHLKNVQNHYEAGAASWSDVLQTQVRLANARNVLIKAQNTCQFARYKLNKEIGLSLHNDAKLSEDLSYEPLTLTLDKSVDTALAHRPEITQAKLKVAMAGAKEEVAYSDTRPTVGLVAMNTWDEKQWPGTENSKWAVGMIVQMNIFDNGLTESQIRQSRQDVVSAKEQARQVIDNVTLDVSQAYLGVREAAERITNNQVAVHQAETDYRLTLERYENGIGTNLDVMDAEVAMTRAKTNYIQALYDYKNSRTQLDKAMGIVNETYERQNKH